MRVFVAGATGVLGRPLLPRLLAAGHEVTAMTRSQERAESLRAAGATAVVADAFEAAAVRQAVGAARPDVVVHHLTSIPAALDPRKMGEQLAENDRLRIEGTRNLVDAALSAGAGRIVAESISFVSAPHGARVLDENAQLWLDAPEPFRRSVHAAEALERAVTDTPGIDGLVLRYGYLYGSGTSYAADGSIADQFRKRRFPVVGNGDGMFSFVHVEDAAEATLLALDHGVAGVYNIVDDSPAPMRSWVPVYADALGAKRPRKVPVWLARLAAGKFAATAATEARGASNAKAKAELGWTPARPSWRQGFAEDLAG